MKRETICKINNVRIKKYLYNSELLEKQLSKNGPGIICNVCEGRSSKYSNIFNSEELPLSKYLTKENELEIQIILNQNTSFSDIRNFKLEGINIGLHTYAATVRFYASPFIENEKYGKQILKNYFESALKTYYSVFNLFTFSKLLLFSSNSLILIGL